MTNQLSPLPSLRPPMPKLGYAGKDEVRLPLGHVLLLGQGAHRKVSLAEQTAGAHQLLGTKHVVTVALQVQRGIQKNAYAGLLIVGQQVPIDDGQTDDRGRAAPQDVEPADPGGEHHADKDHGKDHGRAEIRLHHDQAEGDGRRCPPGTSRAR